MQRSTNIKLCLGNQAEDGEDGLWKPVGVKDATITLSTESNNLGLQRLTETKPPSVRLYGSYLVLCMCVLVVYLLFLVELLTVGVGIVSDSFACFVGPILSNGLLYSALIWGELCSLIETWYAMFGWPPWKAYCFLKGNRRGEMGGELGGKERGENKLKK